MLRHGFMRASLSATVVISLGASAEKPGSQPSRAPVEVWGAGSHRGDSCGVES
ncbi:hypothetical protein [Ewingella americana]